MQTFLPYSDFRKSVECFDRPRLGKQRVECLQLCNGIAGLSSLGWRNHPASKMWSNDLEALIQYGMTCCIHWIERGYLDTVYDKLGLLSDRYRQNYKLTIPTWIGSYKFHSSHRAALLQKDFNYYSKFDWPENSFYRKIGYFWPIPLVADKPVYYDWRNRISDDKEDYFGSTTGLS